VRKTYPKTNPEEVSRYTFAVDVPMVEVVRAKENYEGIEDFGLDII